MARPAKEVDQSTFAGRVAALIRARRLKLKRTVDECCTIADVEPPRWYHWENGRHLPLDALPKIARALDCKPARLMPDE